MENLVSRDPIPKLSKTKQLENPYQSTTSISTSLSRIFLLNDRNKVPLTESSDSDSEDNSNTVAVPRKISAFNGNIGLPANRQSNGQWISDKEVLEPEGHRKTQPFNVIGSHPSVKDVDGGEQNESNLKKMDKSEKEESSTNIHEKVKENSDNDPRKVQVISIDNNKLIHLKPHLHRPTDYWEEVAEESLDEQWLPNLKTSATSKISISIVNKPPLRQASSAIKQSELNDCRNSIIDQIRQLNFMESRVIDEAHPTSHQPSSAARKSPIKDDHTQATARTCFRETKQRQRVKIFGGKTSLTPKKQSALDDCNKKKTVEQRCALEPNIKRRVENLNMEACRSAKKEDHCHREMCGNTQTDCLYKSLQIIDKLTNQQGDCNAKEKPKPGKGEDEELQLNSLDLSMKVDKLLVGLVLSDLLEESTTVDIAKLRNQVEVLLYKLKNSCSSTPQFSKCQQNTPTAKKARPFPRWQLCEEFQRILKSLHYVQVAQERYKMWNVRLHHLSERIKSIHVENQSKQMRRWAEIGQHMKELQESKIHGEACNISVVESFNKYLQREAKELDFALDWIKSSLLADPRLKRKAI